MADFVKWFERTKLNYVCDTAYGGCGSTVAIDPRSVENGGSDLHCPHCGAPHLAVHRESIQVSCEPWLIPVDPEDLNDPEDEDEAVKLADEYYDILFERFGYCTECEKAYRYSVTTELSGAYKCPDPECGCLNEPLSLSDDLLLSIWCKPDDLSLLGKARAEAREREESRDSSNQSESDDVSNSEGDSNMDRKWLWWAAGGSALALLVLLIWSPWNNGSQPQRVQPVPAPVQVVPAPAPVVQQPVIVQPGMVLPPAYYGVDYYDDDWFEVEFEIDLGSYRERNRRRAAESERDYEARLRRMAEDDADRLRNQLKQERAKNEQRVKTERAKSPVAPAAKPASTPATGKPATAPAAKPAAKPAAPAKASDRGGVQGETAKPAAAGQQGTKVVVPDAVKRQAEAEAKKKAAAAKAKAKAEAEAKKKREAEQQKQRQQKPKSKSR